MEHSSTLTPSPSQRVSEQQLKGNGSGELLVLRGTERQCAIPRGSQCQARQSTVDLSETGQVGVKGENFRGLSMAVRVDYTRLTLQKATQ